MLSTDEAFRLTRYSYADISNHARDIRNEAFGEQITYSPKVFIPLTHLCQDSCSYCTFAQSPSKTEKLYLSFEDVSTICQRGRSQGCSEALFTLGESPENKYNEALNWLHENGYETTVDYLVECSKRALMTEFLLPHTNAGAISESALKKLKEVSVSQGMMLESIAGRLCEPGGPHFGSPDKTPARRLATLEAAGRSKIPFTTGILVGIGETRHERIEALLAIRDLHSRYGHIQEVIIQNFMPKDNTGMASIPECDEEEHLWAIAASRLIFGDTIHIQAPPNLVSDTVSLLNAGVDDLGGVSPVTIDYVNPERPWPQLESLSTELLSVGKSLKARAAIYPEFINKLGFVADSVAPYIVGHVDENGYLKNDPLSQTQSVQGSSENQVIDIREPQKIKNDTKNYRRTNSNLPTKT